jgi:pantoate kinase
MAVQLLLDAIGERDSRVALDQQVDVRISYGFGASAASALSAVMAVASALSSRLDREAVAYFAHAADILCRTGLGTVSVIYRYGGAGVIVKPGAPGIAEVRTVSAPKDVRVVTASLSPGVKGPLLSSPDLTKKVNRLGEESIRMASDLTLDGLIRAGEAFSEGLGIASPQVRRLSRIAKSAGALGASQNMVGEAVHALVLERDVERVAAAMKSAEPSSEIGVYGLAPGPATLL